MPPKSKSESKTKCEKSCCTSEPTSSVFLLNDEEGTNEMEMVKLRHPGTDKAAYFVFSKENKKVYELFTFSDSYRSYFIEERVKSDGKLYMTTPIDPLFLALPYLASSVHCSPLDQIFRDDKYPDIERLVECTSLENNITKISEKKGVNVFGYKYDEEKALNWLQSKVEKAVAALRKHSVQVSSSNTVISNNFIKQSSESPETADNYLRYGFGIVSEYLGADLKQKLQARLKISSDNDQSTKRNRSASCDKDQGTRKSKISRATDDSENSPPKANNSNKAKTPNQSTKDKARAKAAVGSKSVSSFFKKSSA